LWVNNWEMSGSSLEMLVNNLVMSANSWVMLGNSLGTLANNWEMLASRMDSLASMRDLLGNSLATLASSLVMLVNTQEMWVNSLVKWVSMMDLLGNIVEMMDCDHTQEKWGSSLVNLVTAYLEILEHMLGMKGNIRVRRRRGRVMDCMGTLQGFQDCQAVGTRLGRSRQVTFHWRRWMRLVKIQVHLVSFHFPYLGSRHCRHTQA